MQCSFDRNRRFLNVWNRLMWEASVNCPIPSSDPFLQTHVTKMIKVFSPYVFPFENEESRNVTRMGLPKSKLEYFRYSSHLDYVVKSQWIVLMILSVQHMRHMSCLDTCDCVHLCEYMFLHTFHKNIHFWAGLLGKVWIICMLKESRVRSTSKP